MLAFLSDDIYGVINVQCHYCVYSVICLYRAKGTVGVTVPSAREKVYEEMQDNLLSLKSSLAFETIIPSQQKKVCRNMNSIPIYFKKINCVQNVKNANKSVEKICALC